MSDLAAELAKLSLEAWPRLRAELDGALAELKTVSGPLAEQLKSTSAHAAEIVKDIAAKKISLDDGRDALARDTAALELLAATVREVAAREALKRGKKALEIAGEVGLVLAKVALKTML